MAVMENNGKNIPLRVLFVDDEENVLRALKRLFMAEDYEVHTASSGADGLAILKEIEIPVIVSDQRMPVMSGAEFLEKSQEWSPDSIRIILTGYADVEAAISAINKGGAYRYVSKPWIDSDLILLVKDAFDKYFLLKDNKYLTELTLKQNEELKKWSTELEFYVQQHTIELTNQNKELNKLNDKLRRNLKDILSSLSGLIELRDKSMHNHSNNVALLSTAMAKEKGLPPSEIEMIATAAQLHDIGKIGDSDIVLTKSLGGLSPEEMTEYVKHPVRGQAAIDCIEDFRMPGILVRHHHEWYNGKGFPDGLKGEDIPLGARIISIADSFDRILQGERQSVDHTLGRIKAQLATRFDAALYTPLEHAAREHFSSIVHAEDIVEKELKIKDLSQGMVLARDVRTGTGLLLLRQGTVLNDKNIDSLKRAVHLDPSKNGIFIIMKRGNA
jgi:response regulator RpfG family c-di-GMP phosphodiesterase